MQMRDIAVPLWVARYMLPPAQWFVGPYRNAGDYWGPPCVEWTRPMCNFRTLRDCIDWAVRVGPYKLIAEGNP